MKLDVRRASDRFRTAGDGIVSRHSFSFGAHYDADNLGFGPLTVHNDDVIAPGAGYGAHRHSDVEIVTWVINGGLRHEDSAGNTGLLVPGLVQRLSAGRGVIHAERNDDATGRSVRFVQMWLRPDESGDEPDYAQHDAGTALASGGLTPLAGPGSPVPLRVRGAGLLGARLDAERSVELPDVPAAHVFVTRGAMHIDGTGVLAEADAARLDGAGARRLTATRDGSEILVWTFTRGLEGRARAPGP